MAGRTVIKLDKTNTPYRYKTFTMSVQCMVNGTTRISVLQSGI